MIKGYQILKPWSQSGKIIFYIARDESNGRQVFIEEIEDEFPSLDDLVSLKNDFEITKSVPSEGALKSLTLVKSSSGIAVVKEYFDGIPLSQFIVNRKLSIPEILKIGIALTGMLQDIHSKFIIHKDVNPDNFLINPNTFEIKLCNFGVATMLSSELAEPTHSEKMRGSVFYISPEQTGRMNRSIDYRTDFYSLGVLLYRLLCNKLPFDSGNVMELVHAHIARYPEEPSRVDPNIPKSLSDIVMKLLSKNAEDRYQSAKALKEDLQQCLRLYSESGNLSAFRPGLNDFSATFRISEKLYGRDKELSELLKAFERARKGAIELILVAGYSGIGKTRLINEIYKPIARENGYYTTGKSDQYSRNSPYTAIGIALGNLIRQFLAESTEDFQQRKNKIQNALEENGQVLIDVIPELELLIGQQPPAMKLGLNESQQRFFKLFKNFLRAIASEDRPLAIFIDDLQWADSGSIELLYQLLISGEIKNTLIIGAYRDNEVSPSHPLMQMLQRFDKHSKQIKTLTLEELNSEQVNQLMADSLHQDTGQTLPITPLVMNKTRGNPFFINQFIQKLVDERLIFFQAGSGHWDWDAVRISSVDITDNVVDLLVKKIQTLSAETQNALRLASCVGSRFDLDTVATISEQDEGVVSAQLWEAVMEDLLNPIGHQSMHFNDPLWKDLGLSVGGEQASSFRFQHDRIQQAAYSLIPDDEKKKTHLRIGRLLLKELSADELDEDLFNVLNHFNFSSELITDAQERTEIAKLDLLAGERAKNSTSYQSALTYLRAGMSLFQREENLSLYNDYLIARSECEYLCGNFEESEQMFNTAVASATTNLEKAEVLARKMQLYENTSRHTEAIRSALDGLKLLGIRLPEKPSQAGILAELLKAKFFLRNKSIDDLKKNKDMKSPQWKLSMKIMVNLWGPAYLHNQNLLALAILRMVTISIRRGNSPESALAYAFYGFVSCAQLKDFKTGYEFGKLGIWLNEKFDDKTLRSKVYVIFGGCIAHWHDPFVNLLDYLRKAHDSGVEANDPIYAGYALDFLSNYHLLEGDPLDSVYEKYKQFIHFGRQIHNLATLHHLLAEARMVCQLMGRKEDTDVFMEFADMNFHEKVMIEFAGKEGVQLPITAHHIYQAEWCCLSGNYEKALDHLKEAKKTIASMLGLAEEARLNFFHSLTLLALAKSDKENSSKNIQQVQKNQKKLRRWAMSGPENWNAKYLLVEAETAALQNNFESAAKLFGEAKSSAQKSNIIQDIAMASEHTAEFFLANGFGDLATSLYRESIFHYRQWGAAAKVKQLEKKIMNTGLAATQGTAPSQSLLNDVASQTTSSSLDLQSIFQASTTISGEVMFEKLLEKLLKIVLENAGAESGSLILVKHDDLVVAAHGDMKEKTVKLYNDAPLNDVDFVSKSIVQFVYHTKENIILNEAVKDPRFSKDPYLIQHNPKSALCQPIIQHGKCIAIIYLENNLATGAFTPARIEVLNLLSGQIAVSMENANLYKRQNELSDAYQRFVPHDFISALGHQSILQVKLGDSISREMTVMFCDIRSYTTLAEGMTGSENFSFINSYLMLVGPVIKKYNGFINHYLGDGFIALFKDSPEDALHAAIEMTQQLSSYNEQRKKENKLPIALGIGLHTGPVMMGIIGDEERHDANVISDAVNISSRLEGLTKHFGASIVLSESTLAGIKNRNEFQFRYLGRIKMKGKEKVLRVDEVFNADDLSTREKKSKSLEMFNAGLNDYFNKQFAEAAVSLRKVVDMNPNDKAARRYLENSAKFMVSGVPDDWDGTEQMSEK